MVYRDYFEHRWGNYLKRKELLDGTKDPKPDKLKADERDRFYKELSFSGWGGSSGHDAPMIAYDAILQSGKNWEELCKRAMFHGGDSDSTGVIAACCYGAMYGYEGVPEGNYRYLEYHNKLVKQAQLLYELAHGSHDEEYVSSEMEQSTEEKSEGIKTQGNLTVEGDPVKKDDDQIEKDDDQIEKSEVQNKQGEDQSEKDNDHCAKGGVQSGNDEVLREKAKVPEGEVNNEQKATSETETPV